jgi:hypothetical protein
MMIDIRESSGYIDVVDEQPELPKEDATKALEKLLAVRSAPLCPPPLNRSLGGGLKSSLPLLLGRLYTQEPFVGSDIVRYARPFIVLTS